MSSSSPATQNTGLGTRPERPDVKQKRSRITYDRLVETGLELLKERDLDSIPVSEIAKAAGYSVGAFYARFKNKDEFHRALVTRYAALRRHDIDRVFTEVDDEDLIPRYFDAQVKRLWGSRHFWRASLYRSFQDTDFWQPLREVVRLVGDKFVERAQRRAGRPLTREEETNIRFAIQVTNGAINNALINRPGPVEFRDADFIDRLVRAFRLVSDWDHLA